jgi:hypothetical protein
MCYIHLRKQKKKNKKKPNKQTNPQIKKTKQTNKNNIVCRWFQENSQMIEYSLKHEFKSHNENPHTSLINTLNCIWFH